MSPIEQQDCIIDLRNRLHYAESQAAEWKEDSLKWRELYRKAIQHDGRIIAQLQEGPR